jgi:ubiquinone/menaquinone biosynthesis C-methylase UbiE/uncharacterized protein YbaR (Trm112 family)
MKLKLLDMLACPKCRGTLICLPTETDDELEVISGSLKCESCEGVYPIRSSIPRFVAEDNYAASFGLQWNLFKYEQIDRATNVNFSEDRFYSETGWTSDWLGGKWILDAGCGAGRFLDIASRSICEVVGVDISNSVDAAAITMRGRPNVHLVQASIYELPFKAEVFDACYSIGVIQHTPDPPKAIKSLPRLLKKGGGIALTIYERKPWTLLNAKYLIRPVTKRMNKRALLFLIKIVMPVFYPITAFLFRLPVIGRLFTFIIPIADYAHAPGLSFKRRYRCVILDTFDMLSPQFDYPQTQEEVEAALSSTGIMNIRRIKTGGLNIVGEKGR